MATVVQVETVKPAVKSATLKFTSGEMADLKVYISTYYQKNYGSGYARYRDQDRLYKTISAAHDGSATEGVTTVAETTF